MNPTPQPASKYDKIFEKINSFAKTLDFSEFDIKRLKKEAEAIKENVDVVDGFSLLGMIACIEGNFESMHSYFRRAIEQSGSDFRHLYNYAYSLLRAGDVKEAYEYALKAYEKNPIPNCTAMLIDIVAILNKRDEFRKYTYEWQKSFGKDHSRLTVPLYFSEYPASTKTMLEFLKTYPEVEEIRKLCSPALIRFFGAPLNVRGEIMQDSSHENKLVLWIQWFGDMDEGLARYDQFEDWYIENDYDLKTDRINFNIEFVEE